MSSRFRYLAVGILLAITLAFMSAPAVMAVLPTGEYPGSNIVTDYVRGGSGAAGIVATLRNLLGTAKQILAPILVFLIGGFGIRLIIARGEEEDFNKATKNFLYVLIGTAFVILASSISDIFSLYQAPAPGGAVTSFLSDNERLAAAAKRVTDQLGIVITLLRYLLGGIAVFYVVRSGSALIFNADEETANKQKEIFVYGFVGFLLIMASETLVRAVFDINPSGGPLAGVLGTLGLGGQAVDIQVNVGVGVGLITNVTNLFLASLSGLFLFSLIAGGAMYTLSAGNEARGEQATKVIIGSLIGLVIAFSSYTLVAEFSKQGGVIQTPQQTAPLAPAPTPAATPATTPTPTPIPAPAPAPSGP